MPDITIQRCTLRIIRKGGWSWGTDPAVLAQRAVGLLSTLLAERLWKWLSDLDGPLDIATPIRLRVPLTRDELLSVMSSHTAGGPGQQATILNERLDQALDQAMAAVMDRPRRSSAPKSAPQPPEPEPTGSDESRDAPGLGPVLRLLLTWRRRDELGLLVAALSESILECWHEALLKPSPLSPIHGSAVAIRQPATPVTGQKEEEAIEHEIAAAKAHLSVAHGTIGEDRAAILRLRIMLLAELAHHLGSLPDTHDLRQRLDRALPLPGLPSHEPSRDSPAASGTRSNVIRGQGQVDGASALPFIALGVLHRIGYLDAVAAVFEAARLAPQFPAFAMGLAYKLLDPPERGWRRDPQTITAAAAFAGLESPPAESELTCLADHADLLLEPLHAVLTRALLRGRSDDEPLLLHEPAPNDGLLLVDTQGCFPVAWLASLESLGAILATCPTAVVLVDRTAAHPERLAQLHKRGIRFVTNAVPTRGETWRRIYGRSMQAWTNTSGATDEILLRFATQLDKTVITAQSAWQAFFVDRPAAPLAGDPRLDRALALAGAVAAAQIAWELWRQRERTDPVLTLERFRDLGGRVRFNNRSVNVLLPLGRRSEDLSQHGLLDDVPDVPWLGGRTVCFERG